VDCLGRGQCVFCLWSRQVVIDPTAIFIFGAYSAFLESLNRGHEVRSTIAQRAAA
jgi:hypothetical protein